jgi:hypothetical protein
MQYAIQIVLPRSDWHRGIIVLFASFGYLQYSFDLFWGLALSPSQTWDGILVGSCLSIYDISQSRLFMFLGILRMVFDVLFWLSADQVEDGLILDKLEKCALLDQPSLIFLILLNWTWTWKKRRNCVEASKALSHSMGFHEQTRLISQKDPEWSIRFCALGKEHGARFCALHMLSTSRQDSRRVDTQTWKQRTFKMLWNGWQKWAKTWRKKRYCSE